MGAVQALWDSKWAEVHAARPDGLPELVPVWQERRYSPATLAAESAALAFWGAALVAGTYLAVTTAAAVGGPLLLGGLAAWTAASLAAAALMPPPKHRGSGGSRSSVQAAKGK